MEEQKENIMSMIKIIKIYVIIMVIGVISACTYTITQVHTEGAASDVVDDTDTITPSTNITVPISAIPQL